MLVASAAVPLPLAAQPQVSRTESGPVRGRIEGGVVAWKGIPFAAPPIGGLRWRAPQPPARWRTLRDAGSYSHDCMQEPFPSDAAPLGTAPAEDCLYLNVWRPAGGARKLPVLLWIYGGGFVNGGSSPPTYAGANMASKGLVFVSFNYRVGRFGTFVHPALTRANEDGGLLGNYGYLDQIAALNWVRRNIAGFGGDPRNITVVGESAGGMSVHMLMTSPLTQGTFQRAVVMSGGNGAGMASRPDVANPFPVAEASGVAFAESKGIARDDPRALAKLRALSAEQVTDGLGLAQLFRPGPRTFSSPFADGRIAVDVADAYRSGRFNHVPVVIGATSADIGGPGGPMIAGARTLAGAIAGKRVPVYAYRFSYVAPSVGGTGAGHASDIPFFLDTQQVKYGDKTAPADAAMGGTISAYLANFARTGNPNGANLPAWPRYNPAEDKIMDFGADGRATPRKDPLVAGR
ncbi:MAG: carboxylesterase family protein [Novosphingobium sp.]